MRFITTVLSLPLRFLRSISACNCSGSNCLTSPVPKCRGLTLKPLRFQGAGIHTVRVLQITSDGHFVMLPSVYAEQTDNLLRLSAFPPNGLFCTAPFRVFSVRPFKIPAAGHARYRHEAVQKNIMCACGCSPPSIAAFGL